MYITLFKNFIFKLADSDALKKVTEHHDFGYRSENVTTAKKFHLLKIKGKKKEHGSILAPGVNRVCPDTT